jgi:hypothetical protein
LSPGRRLIVVAGVLLAPVVFVGPAMLVVDSVLEGGQKFGLVVTIWTLAGLAAVLAWKTAR